MKQFRYVFHASEGRDVYKFECVPDYAYVCLPMYFHTIYMLCTCELSVSAFAWLCTTIYHT